MITPKLDTIADIPLVEYPGSIDEANAEGCENFIARHPEFYQSDFNSAALMSWLDERLAPYTLKNLEIALHAQSVAGLIQKRPATSIPASRKIVTTPVEGRLATAEPTAEERSVLEKTKDDPTLTDHARRKRDELLRRAAVASRLVRSSLRPGEDPQISI
jgi:hypothetical protein